MAASATYQNSASGKTDATATITLAAFDPGSGNNRGLAVCLQFANGTSNQPNPTGISVTYGGAPLIVVPSASGISAGSWLYQIWYYLNSQPSSTPSDIVAKWTNANDITIGAIAANGVDQTTFVRNGTSNSGTGTTTSVVVSSASGNLTVGACAGGSGRTLSAATQTQRWNQAPTQLCAAGSTGAGAATVTHQWTQSVSDVWGGAGFDFMAQVGPAITTQPAGKAVFEGQTAVFSVAATTSGGTVTYQWRKNGLNIVGATSSSYTTPATVYSTDNLAIFDCVVSDDNGSNTSSTAYLVVYMAGTPWHYKS